MLIINQNMRAADFPTVSKVAKDVTIETDGSGNIEQYDLWIASQGMAAVKVPAGASRAGETEWSHSEYSSERAEDRPSDVSKLVTFVAKDGPYCMCAACIRLNPLYRIPPFPLGAASLL